MCLRLVPPGAPVFLKLVGNVIYRVLFMNICYIDSRELKLRKRIIPYQTSYFMDFYRDSSLRYTNRFTKGQKLSNNPDPPNQTVPQRTPTRRLQRF